MVREKTMGTGTDTRSVHEQGPKWRRRQPRPAVWVLLAAVQIFVPAAERATAAAVTRPNAPVTTVVNRTIPRVSPPSAGLVFSSTPTDTEFLHAGLFSEPLAPAAKTTPAENRELAAALVAYRDATRQAGAPDAVEPILKFLATHPDSAWTPVLQLDLGIVYRQTGHFSRALDVWQEGWKQTKGLTSPEGRAIANAMVARLSQLEAYLGRKELLQPLMGSLRDRQVGGTAAQLLVNSQTGLYDMLHQPEDSFRCGPLALKRILYRESDTPAASSLQVLDEAHSTPNGLSLSAVRAIANRAGMDYQMAYRAPGSVMIMPAVAHWKVGHYAAVVGRTDGRYLIQDTTFGDDIRMSNTTLDEEASGYFLVPAGKLPAGWRSVSEEEGRGIWGRGDTGTNHDDGASGSGSGTGGGSGGGGAGGGGAGGGGGGGDSGGGGEGGAGPGGGDAGGGGPGGDNGNGGGNPNSNPGSNPQSDPNSCSTGCTTWTTELQAVGLQLNDTPVGYTPPLGPPVQFHLVYSQRDTQQLATFAYTNFGPKWTFSWLSYITDTVGSSASALLYRRGGGNEPFTFSSTSATTAYQGPYSHGTLTRTVSSGASTGFTLSYPDGSFQRFNQAAPGAGAGGATLFFMTAAGDKAGNTVTLTYDSQLRIVAITDAAGQVSTLTYGLSAAPLVVTKITDPFGRSASFTYNSSGYLSSITDVLGITSSYTYGQGTTPDFINTLTTPYGSTTFTYGDSITNPSLGNTRFLKAVDPLGRTTYVEYDQGVDAGDSSGGVMKDPTQIPQNMNTCNQFLFYRNTFIFDPNQYALAQGTTLNYSLAKVVHWLHTSNETSTSRVMESQKEPLENRIWYNYPGQGTTGGCGTSIFFPVSSTGAVTSGASNRPTVMGRVLDNGTTQLNSYQYNALGNITVATDPLGRQTTSTYAANNVDLLSVANTTSGTQTLQTLTYNSQHLPLTVTGANGRTAQMQYNSHGQLTRYTDQSGHATSRTYDTLGRLKSIQGAITGDTYTYSYDSVSRLSASTDPAGYTVRYSYDAADRLTATTFPDGTTAQRTYNLLDLASTTDRLGQTTSYTYDADREPIAQTDPLGHSATYAYNPAGKLNSYTDRNGHTTTWTLDDQSRRTSKQFPDGSTTSIDYEVTLSLPAVATDALGQITTYTYNSDNTVASRGYSANQPTATVSFTYDPAYSRVLSMTDGIGTTTYSYYPITGTPSLGANRLQSITSPIAGGTGSDTVSYSYDALGRVVSRSVNGVAQTAAYDAIGRVTSKSNLLDTFSYAYSDATSRVTGVTSTQGPNLSMTYYGTTGDELLEEITATTQSGTALDQFGYAYNADDNITGFSEAGAASQAITYNYDKANRLSSADGTAQYGYGYDSASNILSFTTNGTAASYTYTATNAITSGSYDANGSPTSLGGATYTWDGANRAVGFANASGQSSTFTYDGQGRLVRIVDKSNGNVTADHAFTWCGNVRCLAHDNTQTGSPVSTQYFSQGVIVSGVPYYYVRDKLRSVRELVAAGGSVVAQYDYDPYGNPTVINGTGTPDIGYAGYFHHAASGLDFTLNRAYDPVHARWLNRDPAGESGGLNLYAYVAGNPLNAVDPLGLCGANDNENENEDIPDWLEAINNFAENNGPAIDALVAVAEDLEWAESVPGLSQAAVVVQAVAIGAGATSGDPWSEVKAGLEFAGAVAIALNPEIALPVAAGGLGLQGVSAAGQGLTNMENQANQSIADWFAQQAGGSYSTDEDGNPCQPGEDCSP